MKRFAASPSRALAFLVLGIYLCSRGAFASNITDHGPILENLGFPLTVDELESALRSFHMYDSGLYDGDTEHVRHVLDYIEEQREEEIAMLMLPVLRTYMSEIRQRDYKHLYMERMYLNGFQMNVISCLFKVDLEMPDDELRELFGRVLAVLSSKDPSRSAYNAFVRAGLYQVVEVREHLLKFIREKTLDPIAPGFRRTKKAIEDLFSYFAAGLTEQEIGAVFEAFEDEPELLDYFEAALIAYDSGAQ